MLKSGFAMLFVLSCSGCASYSIIDETTEVNGATPGASVTPSSTEINACPGDLDLPAGLADKFEQVEDNALLQGLGGETDLHSRCRSGSF